MVTHLNTNRARRRVTTLIETNALPLSHANTTPVLNNVHCINKFAQITTIAVFVIKTTAWMICRQRHYIMSDHRLKILHQHQDTALAKHAWYFRNHVGAIYTRTARLLNGGLLWVMLILEAKVASASKLWPRPRPGLDLVVLLCNKCKKLTSLKLTVRMMWWYHSTKTAKTFWVTLDGATHGASISCPMHSYI